MAGSRAGVAAGNERHGRRLRTVRAVGRLPARTLRARRLPGGGPASDGRHAAPRHFRRASAQANPRRRNRRDPRFRRARRNRQSGPQDRGRSLLRRRRRVGCGGLDLHRPRRRSHAVEAADPHRWACAAHGDGVDRARGACGRGAHGIPGRRRTGGPGRRRRRSPELRIRGGARGSRRRFPLREEADRTSPRPFAVSYVERWEACGRDGRRGVSSRTLRFPSTAPDPESTSRRQPWRNEPWTDACGTPVAIPI